MTKTFRREDEPETRKRWQDRRRQRIMARLHYIDVGGFTDFDDTTVADLAGIDHARKASAEG